MKTLYDQLTSKINGEISLDEKTLLQYSHDASIYELVPSAVIHPKNTKDVERIV